MKKTASISVIIAAYNEENNVGDSISATDETLKRIFKDYEIIIIDDGSNDRTGAIAEEFAKKNPRISVVHFEKNKGLGAVYREGIRLATKDYVTYLPGDNGLHWGSVARIFERTGEAEVVMGYTANPKDRPLLRRIVSVLFTATLNTLFKLKLKYYNGTVILKLSLARQAKITTNSFAFHAEILIQLLKKRHTYIEVPVMVVQENESPTTNVFRLKNMIGVCATIARLFFRTYLRKH